MKRTEETDPAAPWLEQPTVELRAVLVFLVFGGRGWVHLLRRPHHLLIAGLWFSRLSPEQASEVLGCPLPLAHDGRSIRSGCSPSSVSPATVARTQPPSAVRTTCGSSSSKGLRTGTRAAWRSSRLSRTRSSSSRRGSIWIDRPSMAPPE